jgi:hypothetical protein
MQERPELKLLHGAADIQKTIDRALVHKLTAVARVADCLEKSIKDTPEAPAIAVVGRAGKESVVSAADRQKIQKLKPVEVNAYENIDLDHLVMFAIGWLSDNEIELSTENIVVATFKLFPKKFSLSGYLNYPDSTRVEKCLWRFTSTGKQWLSGKSRHGFMVTEQSRTHIAEAQELLLGSKVKTPRIGSRTRRKEALLAEITGSAAYSKFSTGTTNNISQADICYVLQGTLDSKRETLRENLRSLMGIAEDLERADLLPFLKYIEDALTSSSTTQRI